MEAGLGRRFGGVSLRLDADVGLRLDADVG
jgi:hypothetical protein